MSTPVRQNRSSAIAPVRVRFRKKHFKLAAKAVAAVGPAHPGDAAAVPPYNQLRLRAVDWSVHRAWKDALLDGEGLRLHEWLAGGAARVVKDRPPRVVYRVELPQGDCYVKHFRSRGMRDFLRDLFRGNRAWREWRRISEVAGAGLPTVLPLAIGIPIRPGWTSDAFLVTAAAEHAETLDCYLEKRLPLFPVREQARARQHLARRLGEFVAAMHEGAIAHRDFHPGNILRPVAPIGDESLRLVDLQAVSKHTAPLRWKQSLDNLVTLNLYFSQRATRSDRHRFWHRYLECRPGLVVRQTSFFGLWVPWANLFARATRKFSPDRTPAEVDRTGAVRVEQQTARAAKAFWRRRDRRCLRQGRYFHRLRRAGSSGYAVREFPKHLLAGLLRDADGPMGAPAAVLLKRSSGTQVARVVLANGEKRVRGVYKRWQPRNRRAALLSWLRRSKAMHAWRIGHAMLLRGIETPRPLAMIQKRTLAGGVCSYVLCEEVAGARNLHELAAETASRDGRPLRRVVIRKLARSIRRMHEAGFSHRDLKAANFLVASDAVPRDHEHAQPNGGVALDVLDLDAVSQHTNLSRSRRLQNLARLLVSFYSDKSVTRTEKLRFFNDYLPGGLAAHRDWKLLCRRLDRMAVRKIRRNHRRGRVVA